MSLVQFYILLSITRLLEVHVLTHDNLKGDVLMFHCSTINVTINFYTALDHTQKQATESPSEQFSTEDELPGIDQALETVIGW